MLSNYSFYLNNNLFEVKLDYVTVNNHKNQSMQASPPPFFPNPITYVKLINRSAVVVHLYSLIQQTSSRFSKITSFLKCSVQPLICNRIARFGQEENRVSVLDAFFGCGTAGAIRSVWSDVNWLKWMIRLMVWGWRWLMDNLNMNDDGNIFEYEWGKAKMLPECNTCQSTVERFLILLKVSAFREVILLL